jgi:hypothetical protein
MLGKRRVVVSSVELLNEVCDEKRFGKVVTAALGEVVRSACSFSIIRPHANLFPAQPDGRWSLHRSRSMSVRPTCGSIKLTR